MKSSVSLPVLFQIDEKTKAGYCDQGAVPCPARLTGSENRCGYYGRVLAKSVGTGDRFVQVPICVKATHPAVAKTSTKKPAKSAGKPVTPKPTAKRVLKVPPTPKTV